MVVVWRVAEPQGSGAALFGRHEARCSARPAFPLLVANVDDKRWQHGTLLPVGDHLDLAVGDAIDRIRLRQLPVVMIHRRRQAMLLHASMSRSRFEYRDGIVVRRPRLLRRRKLAAAANRAMNGLSSHDDIARLE